MKHRILLDVEKAGSFTQWLNDEMKDVKPKKVRKPRRKAIEGERVLGEASAMVKRLLVVYRKIRDARVPLQAEINSLGVVLQPHMEPLNEEEPTTAVLQISQDAEGLKLLGTFEQVRAVDRMLYFMQMQIHRQITTEMQLCCAMPANVYSTFNDQWQFVVDAKATAAARGVRLSDGEQEAQTEGEDDDAPKPPRVPPREKMN